RQAPEPTKRGRRERSAGEPGDMSETTDWAGLSSRLSAYSLSGRTPPPEAGDVGEAEAADADADADADGPGEAGTEDDT
ncbi:MAG: hypothetical protein ACRDQT_08355, partial [Gaiellaceae bacterium]